MRYPLVGGSYNARSVIANAQRCVNYYPEKNRDDSPVPFTYYQRPGKKLLVQGPVAPVRCVYQASNKIGYCVIGTGVYRITSTWELDLLGNLSVDYSTPVRMQDNGVDILICDGSTLGYTVNLTTGAFAQLSTDTIFQGANTLAYLDTYLLWNMPGTREFGSTLSGVVSFDPLYFASKTGYPDNLIGLTVNRHELLLFGSLKSEIWYNAGGSLFPFAILPGAYIEHGCASPFSIASIDIETFWLGRDLDGRGVVFCLRGYDTRRVSNFALELAISKMSNVADSVAFTMQLGGHYFYVLTFPSANQTWVYDASLGDNPDYAWHQWAWTDTNGVLNRDRVWTAALVNDVIVGGDWENGKLYQLTIDHYLDDTDPISFIKGFPHVLKELEGGYLPVGTEFARVRFNKFIADMECGGVPLDANGKEAMVTLRTSRDRGHSWDEDVLQSAGAPGAYETIPTWQRLGISRDMVFELSHSIAGPAALNGCFVTSEMEKT